MWIWKMWLSECIVRKQIEQLARVDVELTLAMSKQGNIAI